MPCICFGDTGGVPDFCWGHVELDCNPAHHFGFENWRFGLLLISHYGKCGLNILGYFCAL